MSSSSLSTNSDPETAPLIPQPPSVPVPVPWLQLTPLILLRVLDALTYSIIFPYIVAYITSIPSVPPDKIGLYAGLAEGSLMVVEALMAPFWAYMADKDGRKKCLVWGFAVVVGAMGLMGFGKSVGWIIVWRACYGLNPGPVISRTIFTELSHPSSRALIFSIWGPLFSVGICLGTFLGGLLAEPYGRSPWWIGGENELWKRWPYALPGVVCVALSVYTLVLCQIMTKEIHPVCEPLNQTRPAILDHGNEEEDHEVSIPGRRKSKFIKTLDIPNFKTILVCFCATFAYDGFFTVFSYTSVSQGGLGLSIQTIGIVGAISAIMNFILSPLLVPRLQPRLGIRRFLSMTIGTIPIEAILIPGFQKIAIYGKAAIYSGLAIQLPLKNFHLMAWPLNDQLTAACFDDHPELLATGSAVVLIAGAGGRAIGPTIAGWMFSISTQYPTGSLGRQISWISLLAISLPPLVVTFFLPKNLGVPHQESNDQDSGTVNDAEIEQD
ncbi:hypothetical protein V866_001645 [Kwoniella sp. B9012]